MNKEYALCRKSSREKRRNARMREWRAGEVHWHLPKNEKVALRRVLRQSEEKVV